MNALVLMAYAYPLVAEMEGRRVQTFKVFLNTLHIGCLK